MSTAQIVNLVLDGIFVLFIAFVIIRNCVKGFLSSLISLVKTVVAPVFAVVFNLPIARLISKIFDGACAKWIHKLLLTTKTTELVEGVESVSYDVANIFDGVPNMVTRFILSAGEKSDTVSLIDEFFGANPKMATLDELDVLSNALGARVALGISIIITFVLIFLVVEITLIIVGKLLNKLIQRVTMIKVINIVLGGLVGATIAILVTWAACFGIGKAFEFGQHYYPSIFVDDYWNGTLVVRFFIEHDLLDIIKTFAIR